jgi:MFS family permease
MDVDRSRRRTRRVVGVVWAVIQVTVFAAGLAVGGVLGLSVGSRIPSGPHRWGPLAGMVLGLLAGLFGGILLIRGTPALLLRWRLWRLRRGGVSAKATVALVESRYRYYGRGGYVTTYTVTVQWGRYQGKRRYPFSGKGSDPFTQVCHLGAGVVVRHPAEHPDRFVIDIPFAPVLEDLVV